mmetsp:Transcript_32759/g.23688  ORF Transcript_32759/g.23688 Transcript_32759/m.23688 type:complete len:104 (-) Transcript_32759:1130-1441(-)
MLFVMDDLPKLVKLLASHEEASIIVAVIGMRRLLSFEVDPPITQIIDANAVPKLIDLVGICVRPDLQLEAAWCLTNLASSDEHPDIIQYLIEKGIVEAMTPLL